ncbi:hypothetical protein PDJAM_G00101820 [Pangasius djambal]|uniref:Uncharacterized protein n=1 Tax=Pangasius djambal TaxID=1691987 RepID=A0ACC5Z7S9_9TELE|nr:hypothetical protein [Pangasius djambal]
MLFQKTSTHPCSCWLTGGGTSSSLEPVDHQKHVKKEEPEDEDYLCEATSASVGCITPVDQQKHVKKEEPEDEGYLCGGTSDTVENVDQQKREFQSKDIKEEESEDEDYLCTTTVWEMSDAQFHVFSCSWCPLSYTSQTYLHKHIRRCHYEEYERQLKSGELKYENLTTTRSSSIQQTISEFSSPEKSLTDAKDGCTGTA